MKNQFGGSLLYRKRKSKRPLAFDKPTHLVLRLNERLPSFFNPRDKRLKRLILNLSIKYEIKTYHLILNHTHLHTVLKLNDRMSYAGFIKELTSKLTLYFSKQTGIKLKKIFDFRPWSRIVPWGNPYKILCRYMSKNEIESGVVQKKIFKTQFEDPLQLCLGI